MIPGFSELLIIAGVALLLFGPSRLPQLGGAVGECIRNFRKGMKSNEEETPTSQQSQQVLLTQQTTQSSPETKRVVEVKSE